MLESSIRAVEIVEPGLVVRDQKGDIMGLKYDRLTAVLIKTIKEQQGQIEEKDKLVREQQKQIEVLIKLVHLQIPQTEVCRGKQK